MLRLTRTIFLFIFLFSTFCYSLEVKTAALVGNAVISNQDVRNYQSTLATLGDKTKLSYAVALEQMIDLELCYQYAQRAGIQFSQQKYNAALEQLQVLGLKKEEITPLLSEYIKKQVFLSEVVEHLIKPRIRITKDDMVVLKGDLLKNKNAVKLKRIDNDAQIELGWFKLDSLQVDIRKAVSGLAVGKTSEAVGNSRFQVLDKENDFILSIEYQGLISPKSDVVGMYQTLYKGTLSDLKSKDRRNLFLLERGVEVKRKRLILVLALDSEKLHGKLMELVYPLKVEKELKQLMLNLRESIHVAQY